MTNSGKSVVWTQDYYPFGDSLSGGDLGDDEQGFTNQLVDQSVFWGHQYSGDSILGTPQYSVFWGHHTYFLT